MGKGIETEKPIGSLYRAGATLQELALQKNKSICAIRNQLIREGVKRRHRGNPGVPTPSYDELYDHVFRKLTDPQIAHIYHVSKAVVQRWREDYGIPTRFSLTDRRPKRVYEKPKRGT